MWTDSSLGNHILFKKKNNKCVGLRGNYAGRPKARLSKEEIDEFHSKHYYDHANAKKGDPYEDGWYYMLDGMEDGEGPYVSSRAAFAAAKAFLKTEAEAETKQSNIEMEVVQTREEAIARVEFLADALVPDLRAFVSEIERKPESTMHCADYLELIKSMSHGSASTALVFATALKKAGANHRGVDDALRLWSPKS